MKIIKKLLKYLAIFILPLVTYLLIVTLLSFVSVNEDLVENQQEIPIYILTNGVHTDIVYQLKTNITIGQTNSNLNIQNQKTLRINMQL